jgi:hypothetical protein
VGPVIEIAPPFPPLAPFPPPAAPLADNAAVMVTFVAADNVIDPPLPPTAFPRMFPFVVIAAATFTEDDDDVRLILNPGLLVPFVPPVFNPVTFIAALTVIEPLAVIVNVLEAVLV